MGVKGFNTWFRKQFPGAYVGVKRHYDHLYIDMASYLHEELRRANDVDHFHKLLHARLDKTLRLVEPQKSVVFALDGPAPLAKLLTQRLRRKKEAQKEAKSGPRLLSSLGLTPGTPLMAMIQESLTYYICRRLQTSAWQHLHFELSGATVKGEGEVKILSRLLRPWADVQPEDTHVVIANDSDVVLMALVTPARNVFVLAEPGRVARRGVASLAAGSAAAASKKGRQGRARVAAGARGLPMTMGFTCFSVTALQRLWLHKHPFLRGATSQETAERVARLQVDLVILAILSAGNDYLPALQGGRLQGNSLWESYLTLKAKRDSSHQSLVTWEGSEVQLNAACFTALLKAWPRGLNRHRSTSDDDDVVVYKQPADPHRYLEGMEWLLKMYLEGECSDYRFTYDAYAPSAYQLISMFHANGSPEASSAEPADRQADESADGEVPVDEASNAPAPAPTPVNSQARRLPRISESTEALAPTVCAMALLPGGLTGPAYAPTALRHLMTDPDSPVADLYQECSECLSLSQDRSRCNVESTEARKVLDAAVKAHAVAEAAAAAHKEGLEAAVAQAALEAASAALQDSKRRVQELKDRNRALEAAREDHMRERHPYAPFPIDRLQAAVEAVPLDSFPVVERDAATFGPSYTFWYRRESEDRAASSAFTPPDSPYESESAIAEQPSRMIEREEIPEELPVLVHSQSAIDLAEAEEQAVPASSQQDGSEQAASSEQRNKAAVEGAAEQPPPALHATMGMRHMRRKLSKSIRKIKRQPGLAATVAAPSSPLPSSAEAAQSDHNPTENGATRGDSTASDVDDTDAGSRPEGSSEQKAPQEQVVHVVSDSGLVMLRPARRASAAAAACLQQRPSQGLAGMQRQVGRQHWRAPWPRHTPQKPLFVSSQRVAHCQPASCHSMCLR